VRVFAWIATRARVRRRPTRCFATNGGPNFPGINGNLIAQRVELIRAQARRRRGPFATRIKVAQGRIDGLLVREIRSDIRERSTRFVPCSKARDVFSPDAAFNLDRSDSRHGSSRRSCFSGLFFILFSLALRCLTGANNSDDLVMVYVATIKFDVKKRTYLDHAVKKTDDCRRQTGSRRSKLYVRRAIRIRERTIHLRNVKMSPILSHSRSQGRRNRVRCNPPMMSWEPWS